MATPPKASDSDTNDRDASMKADGGLENTLTALDLFLQSTAPLEKAVDVAQGES